MGSSNTTNPTVFSGIAAADDVKEPFRPLKPEDVRSYIHEAVDFICDYYTTVESMPVLPDVKPGYLQHEFMASPPTYPAPFHVTMKELKASIIPGMTHWASPNFFAFFPATNSAVAIAGDLIASAMNTVGFTWQAAPAATELEVLALNWLAQLLHLPDTFMSHTATGDRGTGGAVILGTTSEAMLVTLVAARDAALRRSGSVRVFGMPGLVVYAGDQTHSTFFKACRLAGFDPANIRSIPAGPETQYALDPAKLLEAMQADVDVGLVPTYVCATRLHLPGAPPPPQRRRARGLHQRHPHKWLLTCLDCTCLYVRDAHRLSDSMETNPEYLKNDATDSHEVTDLKDMQIGLGRRFRGLKLWMVMRTYGPAELQEHIRSDVNMAKLFEGLVRTDHRFEVVVPRNFAMVCFRIKARGAITEEAADEVNRVLMKNLNKTGKAYFAHTVLSDRILLRFAVGSSLQEERHVRSAWELIKRTTNDLMMD
uniref:Aromatic-L-amino-acid decarboxylase n=1 Tax=Aegilops tauschii TaxID=37682 RepID=M8BYE1_AEGTA